MGLRLWFKDVRLWVWDAMGMQNLNSVERLSSLQQCSLFKVALQALLFYPKASWAGDAPGFRVYLEGRGD